MSRAWDALETQGAQSLALIEGLEETEGDFDADLGAELARQRHLRQGILEDLAQCRSRPLRLALVGRDRNVLWQGANMLVPRRSNDVSEIRRPEDLRVGVPFSWGVVEDGPEGEKSFSPDAPLEVHEGLRRGEVELVVGLLPSGEGWFGRAWPEVEGMLLLGDPPPGDLPEDAIPWEIAPLEGDDLAWRWRYALVALGDRVLQRRTESALARSRDLLGLGQEGRAVFRRIRAALREDAWSCGERLSEGEGFWDDSVRLHALTLGALVRKEGGFGPEGGLLGQLAKAKEQGEQAVRQHLQATAAPDFSRAALSLARRIFRPLERECWRPVRMLERTFLQRAQELVLDGVVLESVPTFGAVLQQSLTSLLSFFLASLFSFVNIITYLIMGILFWGYVRFPKVSVLGWSTIDLTPYYLGVAFLVLTVFFFNNITLILKQIKIFSLSKTLALARAWHRANTTAYFSGALQEATEPVERDLLQVLREARRQVGRVLDRMRSLEQTYGEDLGRLQDTVEDFCDVVESWTQRAKVRRGR